MSWDDIPKFVWSRRRFLRGSLGALVGGAGMACLPRHRGVNPPIGTRTRTFDDDPIADVVAPSDRNFHGDELERFHGVLWNKRAALSERGGLLTDVAACEKRRVVIVGGGLSALSCAWMLKDCQPLLLDGATRFGGNAQGQRWGDLEYSIGSAYFTKSSLDEEHMRMLQSLGLHNVWREDDPTHDQMYIDGKIYPEFWFGGSDRSRANDFRAAWDYFKRVRQTGYPEVPNSGSLSEEKYRALDRRSFLDEVRLNLKEQLHPHVEDVIREYCWSSFGADPTEISAVAGLNFLASDLGGMYVLPGGNAGLAQRLVQDLRLSLPEGSLRSASMVVDIRRQGDQVLTTYINSDNALRTVVSDVCVVCTPKFVAKVLIDDLPQTQRQAISQYNYRSFVVGHVLIEQPRAADFHDLFCIVGRPPSGSLSDELETRPFTDVVLATFAKHGHPSRVVLNLYRGYPFDGGRTELFLPDAYQTVRTRMETELPAVLSALGLQQNMVKDLRFSRWGHPLVTPKPGMISDGVHERASAPHAERIFFAQQDNHLLPSFESGFYAAAEAAENIRHII